MGNENAEFSSMCSLAAAGIYLYVHGKMKTSMSSKKSIRCASM